MFVFSSVKTIPATISNKVGNNVTNVTSRKLYLSLKIYIVIKPTMYANGTVYTTAYIIRLLYVTPLIRAVQVGKMPNIISWNGESKNKR
jgi:hypothetical protein